MKNTVLLTGISGYIGLNVAKELLDEGYKVRGSVRNKNKETSVRQTLEKAGASTKNLSFVSLDLTSDKGWEDAANGMEYVMHVASPFVLKNPKTKMN